MSIKFDRRVYLVRNAAILFRPAVALGLHYPTCGRMLCVRTRLASHFFFLRSICSDSYVSNFAGCLLLLTNLQVKGIVNST